MKHMKNLVCILLCLFVLTSCSTLKEENPYLKNIRDQVQGAGKLFGVAYLGNVEGDFEAIGEYFSGQEYRKVYPFIQDVRESHFVEIEGNELYCVVPADGDVTITVSQVELNEKISQLQPTKELATYTDGQPVLIRGNISETIPNLMFLAKKGDVVTSYVPHLSLKNGVLENQEQLMYDFSPYELMDRYNGMDENANWDFSGEWTCTVTEFNDKTYNLNLSMTNDGLIDFTFDSDTMKGSYTGNWLVMSEGRIRMELGGSTQDSQMPGAVGYHTDVDAIYSWEVKDGVFVLTYLNGTPLYPSATVSEFQFTPVE